MQIQLFSMTHGDEGGSDLNYGAAIDCSGVFDAKWVGGVHGIRGTSSAQQQHSSSTANTESDLMAVALADGSCTLMQAAFSSIQSVSVCEDAAVGGMALSCNWGPGQDVVYCSSSNGHVASCRVTDANLELETSWAAHDMEVWMVSCDLHRVRLCSCTVTHIASTGSQCHQPRVHQAGADYWPVSMHAHQ